MLKSAPLQGKENEQFKIPGLLWTVLQTALSLITYLIDDLSQVSFKGTYALTVGDRKLKLRQTITSN